MRYFTWKIIFAVVCMVGDLILSNVELGSGAFGSVFEASYKGQECAAKMLSNHARDLFRSMKASGIQEARKKCILDECSFLEELQHENIICHITTVWEPINKLPILVMERMDCSLKNFIKENRPLDLMLQLTICHGVSSGLHYLHANDIIHRDLCDDNVLLQTKPLAVKISDFGMSKMMEYESVTATVTAVGHRKGYLPPEGEIYGNSSDEDDETHDNKALYSHSLDIYSFGAVATQTVCSADQFKSRKAQKRTFTKIEEQHPLKPIIRSCLSEDSHKRPLAKYLTADIVTIIYAIPKVELRQ